MSNWKQRLSNIWINLPIKSADLIESAKAELVHDPVHPFHNLKKLRVTCRDFHTEERPAGDEITHPHVYGKITEELDEISNNTSIKRF